MTKGLTVQLHMYRSCPRTQAISNCLKDYFWSKKKSRIFETNHTLERNQTCMPYSIKCEINKDSLSN